MFGAHRAGDISFYEELGVDTNASAEEIRDAFRALARMLHPDQQTDPQLKEIAERQMRKLNRIYSVLSDPERRRHYDELLEDEYPHIVLRARSEELRPLIGRFVWGGAIVLSASLLFWIWWDNSGSPQNRPRNASVETVTAKGTADAVPAAGDSADIAKLRADLRSVAAQRDAAIREIARLRGSAAAQEGAGDSAPPASAVPAPAQIAVAVLPTITELPSAPKPPVLPARTAVVAPSPPPRPARPVNNSLAGFWFYVKPPEGQQNKNGALYLPEFIETTITEQNGLLQGKYRSRFQIVDRAISPDVNFTFSGPAAGAASYNWTGPGGAKGELTLKLTAENQLRVDWTASELGSQQGLASGTAVLKRRIE